MSGIIDAGYKLGDPPPIKKVVFCVPVYPKPFKETEEAIKAECAVLHKEGWLTDSLWQVGCPYISAARCILLRYALDENATAVVFIDQDISWPAGEVLKLLNAEGGLVAGTYRYKQDGNEKYMGSLKESPQGKPIVRADGCVEALWAPAGFMRVSRVALNQMMKAHPELICGEPCRPHFDMFGHGVIDGEWRGEDVAACLRWRNMGEKLWIVPDLDITHHSPEKAYPGNLHKFLSRTIVADPNRFAAKKTAP